MQTDRARDRRRRQETRIGTLRRRLVLTSAFGFAALFGLAAQHAVGSSKRRVTTLGPRAAAVATRSVFFDQVDGGFAFDDTAPPSASAPAVSSAPTSQQTPPPVAQTSVS